MCPSAALINTNHTNALPHRINKTGGTICLGGKAFHHQSALPVFYRCFEALFPSPKHAPDILNLANIPADTSRFICYNTACSCHVFPGRTLIVVSFTVGECAPIVGGLEQEQEIAKGSSCSYFVGA
ncbi:hypothetical protein ElyMa_002314800 [Elysia marginata]|uniref:Uncharacterized protein n=1 Tax=Elysia marginata TaxID=1093978 RepID=A0AAV4G4M9_9GAST|nr:hypothetical protein ElyMa_002314800 [Elysia marginata]